MNGENGAEGSIGIHMPENGNEQELQGVPETSKNSVFKQYQEKALDVLQQQNFLRRDEQGRIICNLNRFADTIDFNLFKRKMGPLASSPEYGNNKWLGTIYHTFKDLNVYSEEDYQKVQEGAEIEAKPFIISCTCYV